MSSAVAGPVVDTESVREFMREAVGAMSEAEQDRVASDLETKHAHFRALFSGPGAASRLSAEELQSVLRSVFATRRRARAILASPAAEGLGARIDDLLHGNAPLEARFQAFCERPLGPGDGAGHDLASELLHFTYPDDYWLWTRWAWDAGSRTGALALVTQEFELSGTSAGDTYRRVGQATAFVHETARAAGLARVPRFGIDVLLACVYGVYLTTAVRLRMTQEFGRVIPELPELVRRLLGVHRMES